MCECCLACVVHADLKVEADLKLKMMMDNYYHLCNFEIPVLTVVARDTDGSRKQVFRVRACVHKRVRAYVCVM